MYKYEELRKEIFTDEGQKDFITMRDHVKEMLDFSGAFMMTHAIKTSKLSGSTWLHMAYIDRMVEMGEIGEITGPCTAGQHRIFIKRR